jgi:predicted Ser/Thr protein kinase
MVEGGRESALVPNEKEMPMSLTPGTLLGRYAILERLGEGGMGEVYRARDDRLDREVALKVLQPRLAEDPEYRARFEREAQLQAKFSHSGIATLYSVEEVGGQTFLVMELVEGQSLAKRLQRGRLPVDKALTICREIAVALEFAHARHIVHRDLKPGNVMVLPEGKIKVLDFGLAKLASPDVSGETVDYQPQTREGTIAGTPAYMSPERASGKGFAGASDEETISKRGDVWAFGCILYECLARKQAFGGGTLSSTLAAVLRDEPDWQALPELPPRLLALIRRCLQKDPNGRQHCMGDARLEIEEALAGPVHEPVPAPRKGSWLVFPLALTLVLAMGILVGIGIPWQSPPESGAAGEPSPPPPPPVGKPTWPRPTNWNGEWLLGDETQAAFGPRVSPGGNWLAFLVMEKGQAQLAVIPLDNGRPSGEWQVLTPDREQGGVGGSVISFCWVTNDLLYYDRYYSRPVGVFQIRPTKKWAANDREVQSRVVADAYCPQKTEKGLLVAKMDEQGDLSIWHHGLEGERRVLEPSLQIDISGDEAWWPPPIRMLHHSNEAVFCGKLLDEKTKLPQRHLYRLNLDNKKPPTQLSHKPIPHDLIALTVSRDDQYVYLVMPAGDAYRIVRYPLEGSGGLEPVLTLSRPAYGLDVDDQGRLYFDEFDRPLEVVRFSLDGKEVKRIPQPTYDHLQHPVEIPGGQILLPSKVSGRDRLLLAKPPKDLAPLLSLGLGLETRLPATFVPRSQTEPNRLAFVADDDVRLGVLPEGERGVDNAKRVMSAKGLSALAAAPDGSKLYFVRDKRIWSVDCNGEHEEEVAKGDGVAVHPTDGRLLVTRFEGKEEGVRLFWVQAGGQVEAVEVQPPRELRLAPDGIGGRAISRDDKVLVTVESPDRWTWRTALLDLKTGVLQTPIDTPSTGDIYRANWNVNYDRVIGSHLVLRCRLWRFTPSNKRHGADG